MMRKLVVDVVVSLEGFEIVVVDFLVVVDLLATD